MLSLLFAALLLPSTAGAQNAAHRRTIAELKNLALSQGESDTLGANVAMMIGYPARKLAIKELYFDQGVTPDGYEHTFSVVVDSALQRPEIVWSAVHEWMSGGTKMVAGTTFRLSQGGALLNAAAASGPLGHLTRTPLFGKKAASAFEKERRFWTDESAKYRWSK